MTPVYHQKDSLFTITRNYKWNTFLYFDLSAIRCLKTRA